MIWVLASSLLTLGMCQSAGAPAEAPPFVNPSFGSTRAALSIGRFQPSGGTGVLISPAGVVATAYHVVAPCVARLRRDPKTKTFFGADGAYRGEHGGLPCDDLWISFPKPPCDSKDEARLPVQLLAVPATERARALGDRKGSADREEYPIPKADFALVKVEPPMNNYLRLSDRPPSLNESVWVTGAFTYSAEVFGDSNQRLFTWLTSVQAMMQAALFDVMATAALDPAAGARAAKEALDFYAHEISADQEVRELVDMYAEDSLTELGEMAKGADEAAHRVRESLEKAAEGAEKLASRTDIEPEVALHERERAAALRDLARSGPAGAGRLREFFLARKRESRRIAEREFAHLSADFSHLSKNWCGKAVSYGRVTNVGDLVFRTDAFAAPGMSGGPVLDSSGHVLGLLIMAREDMGLVYRSDNVVAARADVIRREFGALLEGGTKE